MENGELLKRLLELSRSLPGEHLQHEQKKLVLNLAANLDVELNESTLEENHDHHTEEQENQPEKRVHENIPPKVEHVPLKPVTQAPKSFSSAREMFEQQVQPDIKAKKHIRKSLPAPRSSSAPPSTGGSECDLSDPKIAEAYENVRDDSSDYDWLLLGYGTSKKALQLYGSGTGGLTEFASKLGNSEVLYGYVRVKYGDSARAKFVMVTYVPEGLSGLSKAKANMHKPSVDQFLKYHHVQVNATTTSDLQEATVQAKLASAGGANYGTGGAAPAGSENFGNIKNNARSFFSETEKKGSVNIVYNKDPLSTTTPVNLTGRAGITEKYIK